jgi:hypothetical protein
MGLKHSGVCSFRKGGQWVEGATMLAVCSCMDFNSVYDTESQLHLYWWLLEETGNLKQMGNGFIAVLTNSSPRRAAVYMDIFNSGFVSC